MLKLSYLFFIFLLVPTCMRAQTGCVRAALLTRIYTSLQSGNNYNATPFTDAAGGCTYAQTGTACTVTGLGSGFRGTVGVLTCPIDSDIWEMMIIAAGIGFFVISKNKLSKTNSSASLGL